jgi:hypothetical protein
MGGDLDKLYAVTEKVRGDLMRGLTPDMVKEHLQRCLNVRNRVVVVGHRR